MRNKIVYDMTTKSTNIHIPKLRFPEFLSDGEWEVKRLGEIAERITDKVGNADLRPVSISAGIGFVDQKNKFGRDISGNQYSNYIVLKKGEFAYNKGNSIKYPQGCVYKLKEFDVVACPNVFVCFRIIDENVCPDFLSAYFAYNYHGAQLQQFITSGVRSNGLLNISAENFFSIQIPLPPLAEQRRIAACLLALDEMLSATKDKLEQLKAYKKGLMQKLIPAKGKTLPEYRFKEFEKDGEWKVMKLGDVTKVVNRRNKSNRNLPIYSISNKDGFIPQSEQFDGLDSNSRGYDTSMYKIVTSDTFAYNPARINVGSVGYSGNIKECLVSSLYVCFKTTEEVDDAFLIYFMDTSLFKLAVDNNVEGGIRSYLFYENFSKIKIIFPSISEQKKIASCLKAIDEIIDALSNKFSELERYKIGMMQKMFPIIK